MNSGGETEGDAKPHVSVAAGDRNRLLSDQLPSLRRYARALTKDRDNADDLVQDCYARACSRFHLWQHGTNLRAWLFSIMHNVYVNGVRRAVIRPDGVYVEDLEQMADTAPRQETLSEALGLESALAQLPDGQREVLLMVCLEELTYQEVADALQVPIGTVMSRLARAREKLRQLSGGARPPGLKRVK